MKKTLLFLTVLGFAGLLSGQVPVIKEKKGESLLPHITYVSNSNLEETERLDSTIYETWSGTAWVLVDKQRYSYSKNGSTTTVIIQKRKAGSLWVDSLKTETTVNAAGLVTLEISYSYNVNQWVPLYKSEKTYNAAGDLTLWAVYVYVIEDSIGWSGSYKSEIFYEGADFSYEIVYNGTTFAGWEKMGKYEYSKTNGKLTQIDRYVWAGDEWKKTHRYIQSYNSAGRMITEVMYDYNPLSYIYTETSKTEFTHDNNGNRITQVNYYRVTTFLGERLWQKNDSISNAWDSRGRNTYHANYIWDIPGGIWNGEWKNQISFSEIPVSHSIDITSGWTLSAWTNYAKLTSYYSSAITGKGDKKSDLRISVYPNPASEFMIFPGLSGYTTVELINLRGEKVLEQKLSDDGILPVSNLSKGLYIYKVTSNGITRTGRVILK